MDIRISVGLTKDGKPFALVRFLEAGQLPIFKTVSLPDDVTKYDDMVAAFILERAPEARMWQGVLWPVTH